MGNVCWFTKSKENKLKEIFFLKTLVTIKHPEQESFCYTGILKSLQQEFEDKGI